MSVISSRDVRENTHGKLGVCVTLFTTFVLAHPSSAHHSFAMFDQTKTQTVTGAVKEFQFTSPHAWVQVLTTDSKGEAIEWGFEMGSAAALSRQGWKKTEFKPGDKITVTFHPLKDGSPAGSFMSAVREDGTPVGPQASASR